jgi:hypothetical protein
MVAWQISGAAAPAGLHVSVPGQILNVDGGSTTH